MCSVLGIYPDGASLSLQSGGVRWQQTKTQKPYLSTTSLSFSDNSLVAWHVKVEASKSDTLALLTSRNGASMPTT